MTRISQADAERLSDTRTPQGHFAVVRDELAALDVGAKSAWQIVALDAVQDPGNVGALVRTAAAFGADGVLVGPGCADPTHPRVLRSATSAWFSLPIWRSVDLSEELRSLKASGATIFGADSEGTAIDRVCVPPRAIWLFGNEGAGLSPDLAPLLDRRVAVPIADQVESLNVAVAAGIILHQVRRQSDSSRF